METLRIPCEEAQKLKDRLTDLGLEPRKVEHTLWSLKGEGVYLNLYNSCVLLIQGKKAKEWKEKVLSLLSVPKRPVGGCDESGKGDIFGPLVLCCAVIKPENFLRVLELTPKDSKKMKDEEVEEKAPLLKKLVMVKCIKILPERFNRLYEEMGSVNRIMDKAYLRILKEFESAPPERVIVDAYREGNPFSSYGWVRMEKKGERDVAVSCAGIIARWKFLKTLKELEDIHGVKLPKGASEEVKTKAYKILQRDPALARKLIKLSYL